LPTDDDKRRLMLDVAIKLTNVRAELMNKSQVSYSYLN